MKRFIFGLSLAAGLFMVSSPAWAQYSSPNYKVEEVFFGAGGELETTSPNFKAQSGVGSLGVGQVAGTTHDAMTGFLTPGDPFLEMNITSSLVDLGVLDAASAQTGAASFQIRAYTNSGYTVTTVSQPPETAGGHVLNPMSSQAASSVGTEQFGINLRANTSPTTFGADPVPVPDATFANGSAALGYEIANQYKYGVGDAIAGTTTSGWGSTVFTISYIANITSITEAGEYSMIHDLVAVPTY